MKKIKLTKEKIAFSLIMLLSAVMNFANLSIEGYGNQYYAAGVKSMTMSLKNFFFVSFESFDPAGFVTIDKPPLGFWIQAISAKIFGFSGWSILLPEALAGVISVALIYYLVKRSFGSAAGLISALCLAVTPVFVAVSRNNTVDNLLVMTLLFACWALSLAAENGKLKYLIISMVIVGIGFNIKMLQAYMIVPALYLTYLLSTAVSLKKRILHLIAATVVLIVVSLSWAFVVDLVPAKYRPYVGSSTNNSEMELIIGHNGLERLGLSGTTAGGQGGNKGSGYGMRNFSNNGYNPGQPPSGTTNNNGTTNSSGTTTSNDLTGNNNMPVPTGNNGTAENNNSMPAPPNGMQNGNMPQRNGNMKSGGGMGGTFGGNEPASIIRLFSNNSLSDQIIWLVPIALIGFAAAAFKEKLKFPFDNSRKLSLVLWFMWFLPEFIYFSFTKGLFHPYYLTMLAPPVAALAGIGAVSMWKLYKEGGIKKWILPAAIIVNVIVEILILSYYSTYRTAKILMLISAVLCIGSIIAFVITNFFKSNSAEKVKTVFISIALAGLLIAPAVWSSTTWFYTESGTFPSAGVELASSNNVGTGMDNANSTSDSTEQLVKFLKANTTTEKYLVAVPSSNSATDIIIKTGGSVMALGGFSGSDNILTLSEFKQMVKNGVVRYAIVDGGGGAGGNSEITSWIKKNGAAVSWNSSSKSKTSSGTDATKSTGTNSTQSSSTNKNQSTGTNNNQGFQRNDGSGGRNSIQTVYDLKNAVK
jgi:4-amino-4-deoxy-L-arabinose transferase-like glycosyltransferase